MARLKDYIQPLNWVVLCNSFSVAAKVKKLMYIMFFQLSSGAWITLDELHEVIVML